MLQSNNIAEILETKIICKEPGRFLGFGSEHYLNEAGHPKIKKEMLEPDRYVGWPTVVKTDGGELIVAYSCDRDSHICPWGKTHLIRSSDNGKSWTKPEVVNNSSLDDRDAGLMELIYLKEILLHTAGLLCLKVQAKR